MKTIHPAVAEHVMEENEKLREALKFALVTMSVTAKSERLAEVERRALLVEAARIDAALSQQVEPTDTFTAVDMATAAAQGFRDGQAAVEQAAAQDEREAFEAWRLEKFCGGTERLRKCINAPDVYYYTAEQEAWKVWQARAALIRPAQTEQQPVAIANRGEHAFWVRWTDEGKSLRGPGIKLYASPIAQTAPQPEQSQAVTDMVLSPDAQKILTECIGAHAYVVAALVEGRPDLALAEARKWVEAFRKAAQGGDA